MASNKPLRLPTIMHDAARNPGFAAGAFGLSAWAYVGMSETIADYEGPQLGYGLGIAYESLVIGMAWEGRRRADQCLDAGRPITGHRRWLIGAISVGVMSGALAAWHGWSRGEGVFAISRAVAPILAAVAVHLFFQSAASARDLERKAQIAEDQETAVLDMLDAVRLAQIAPAGERAARIAAVNTAVTKVHRNVPAAVTKQVTAPHLESERTIHAVIREAADLAGTWLDEPKQPAAPVTPADLPAIEAVTHDIAPAAAGVIEPILVTHDADTIRPAGPTERVTPAGVAAADDTPARVSTRTRVTTPADDTAGTDTARSSWPRYSPAAARTTTPAEPMTPAVDVIDGDGHLYEQLPDDATPEERAERARALAYSIGTVDETGSLRISTTVADRIAAVVGRKRRQVYRYLEGENNDTTDTGSVPIVPARALDLDEAQPDGGTAAYAEAAMMASR